MEQEKSDSLAATPEEEEMAPGGVEMPRHRLIMLFTGLLVAMLTSSLDQTIVSTALPTIVGDLGGADHMQWVVTAEVLAMTATMPVFGRLSDLMGRKGLFMFALGLLAAGSTVCALANGMPMLIAGRAVQGAGGGGLTILSQAIVADVVPARVRGTYMGVMGMAFAVPALLGPLLGGFFTDVVSWHWAFWMNLPLVALSMAAAAFLLPGGKPAGAERVRFDLWGTLSLSGALVCLTLATSLAGTVFAWDSPQAGGLLVATAALAAAFVLAERRAAQPVVPLGLFRNRNFVLTTLAGLFGMLALMGAATYLPTFFQVAQGMSATGAGFMELPAGVGEVVATIGAGVLISRTGKYKALMAVSFAIASASMWLMSTITAQTSTALIACYLLALGFGIGLNVENLVLIAQNEFPNSMVGTVTAANNFFREVGTTLGASLVGALFTANLGRTLAACLEPVGGMAALGVSASSITPELVREMPAAVADAVADAYAEALAPVFLAVTPLLLASLVLMCFLKNTPLREKGGVEAGGVRRAPGSATSWLPAARRPGSPARVIMPPAKRARGLGAPWRRHDAPRRRLSPVARPRPYGAAREQERAGMSIITDGDGAPAAALGVDWGGSAAKLVLVGNNRRELRVLESRFIPNEELSGSAEALLARVASLARVARVGRVAVTGVGASRLPDEMLGLPVLRVDPEFEAVGFGGLALAREEARRRGGASGGPRDLVVANIGSGTSLVRVRGEGEAPDGSSESGGLGGASPFPAIEHLGGSGMGGKMLAGLGALLVGTSDVQELAALAAAGNRGAVDLQVGDLSAEDIPGLPRDLTACNFGKARPGARREDVAAALLNLLFESAGMMAVFACQGTGARDVALTGTCATLPGLVQVASCLGELHGLRIMVPELAPYATAIGAALATRDRRD